MQKKVFLSCSSKDQEIALTICDALEARGHACWMSSRDVMPGENFQGAIVRAIRNAGAMVLIFSANANNSDEIKKEIALAGQNKLMVIPVRVEDVTPSEDFSYELATRQWVDLFRNWEFAIDQLGRQIDYVIPKAAAEAVSELVPAPEPVLVIKEMPVVKEPPAPSPTQAQKTPGEPAQKPKVFLARHRLPVAAGLLLLIGGGAAAFLLHKPSPVPAVKTASIAQAAKPAPAPKAAAQKPAPSNPAAAKIRVGQRSQTLNPKVQEAVDLARAAEKQARTAQANALATAQQGEAAAKQVEAGDQIVAQQEAAGINPTTGYQSLAGNVADGLATWDGQVAFIWHGNVADEHSAGLGVYRIISGTFKGSRYEGVMQNGLKEGAGVGADFVDSNDQGRYEGEWQDGKMQGAGVRIYPRYEDAGKWAASSMTYGVQRQKDDGTLAVGHFGHGVLNGYGVEYDAQGHIAEQGLYENGTLKTPLAGK